MSEELRRHVYVLTNEAMPGLVKIGVTKLDDPSERAEQLYTTGVPLPFDVEYAALVGNAKDIERALHNAFRDNRINPKREFFRIQPDQAIGVLKLFDLQETTDEVRATFERSVSSSEKQAVDNARRRRPPLNFEEMGLSIGAELEFVQDETITVQVVEAKKVRFEGSPQSLTAVTSTLLGLEYSVQPTSYWTYEGKNLIDIYNDTYTSEIA